MKKVILILTLVSLFRVFFATHTELTEDEAYYWVWSQNPDLSYFDHPPFVAYSILVSTKIFGNNELGVRFPAIFYSFLAGILIFLISGKEIYSILLALSSLILDVGGVITTPDTSLVLFSLLFFYLMQKEKFLPAGIALGLALLSKYQAVLLAPLYIFYLRKNLKNIQFYLSPIIALLIFTPVFVWNFEHNFISFNFQLHHGYAGNLNLKYPLKYVLDTILVLTPPLSLVVIYFALKETFSSNNKPLLFMVWFPWLFFFISSFKGRPEANWPCISYAFLPAFISGDYKKLNKKLRDSLLIFSYFLIFLIHLHAMEPFIPLKKDPSERLHGWKRLAEEVKYYADSLRVDLIAANTYQLASELQFYLPGHPYVHALNIGRRANQYTIWRYKAENKKRILYTGKLNSLFYKKFDSIRYLGSVKKGRKTLKVYLLEVLPQRYIN